MTFTIKLRLCCNDRRHRSFKYLSIQMMREVYDVCVCPGTSALDNQLLHTCKLVHFQAMVKRYNMHRSTKCSHTCVHDIISGL